MFRIIDWVERLCERIYYGTEDTDPEWAQAFDNLNSYYQDRDRKDPSRTRAPECRMDPGLRKASRKTLSENRRTAIGSGAGWRQHRPPAET